MPQEFDVLGGMLQVFDVQAAMLLEERFLEPKVIQRLST